MSQHIHFIGLSAVQIKCGNHSLNAPNDLHIIWDSLKLTRKGNVSNWNFIAASLTVQTSAGHFSIRLLVTHLFNQIQVNSCECTQMTSAVTVTVTEVRPIWIAIVNRIIGDLSAISIQFCFFRNSHIRLNDHNFRHKQVPFNDAPVKTTF